MRSKRGVGGGYVLAREPKEILLSDIVSAVDGPIVAGDFGEPHTNGACDHEGQCVLLAIWADVGEHMRSYLALTEPGRHRGHGPRRGRWPAEQALNRRANVRPLEHSTDEIRLAAATRSRARSPVTGWAKRSRSACRNGRGTGNDWRAPP